MDKQKKLDRLGKEVKDFFTTPLFNENQSEIMKEQDLMLDTIEYMHDNVEEYETMLRK